jgi:uncharacterized protein YndB with AHSA1/START domain
MPYGTRPVVGGVFETIEEHAQIVFTCVWDAPDPHANIPTRVRIDFIEKSAGTEVVITHKRLPSEEAGKRYLHGWEGTLDRLSAFLAWDCDLPGAGELFHA